MTKAFQMALHFVVLFLLFFGFNFYGINTRYVATVLLAILLVITPGSLNIFIRVFKSIENKKILGSMVLYTIITTLITYFHQESDLNLAIGVSRLLIFYIDCLMLWCLLPKEHTDASIKLLIGIFIAQSLIIIAAFLSPNILNIVRQFQYEDIMAIADSYLDYGTFRGLALSGEQFHGLTVSFGFVSLFTMKEYLDTRDAKWVLVFLLLFAANMYVGRTGFIGFILAVVYLLWSGHISLKLVVKIIVVSCLIGITLYSIMPANIKSTIDDSVFRYAFQLFYNYQETGRWETSTTDRVAEMWQEDFSISTFVLGDGLFVNSDGTYYRHVDVGYLRQLFYGGVFFVIYSVVMVWKMLVGYTKRFHMGQYKFEITVFVFLMIVHTKGLDIMGAIEPMLVVFIYYIHKYIATKKIFLKYA